MKLGERAERGECFAAEAKCLEGGEVIVGRELRGVVLEGYRVVVFWRDASTVVLDFNSVESIVLEANLYADCQPSCSAMRRASIPMDVAPASMLFSTSSLHTDWRSTMTWPDWIWWTERPSMGLMVAMSTHAGGRWSPGDYAKLTRS